MKRLMSLVAVSAIALFGASASGLAFAQDVDGDGVPDAEDNCPADFNPDQADSDVEFEPREISTAANGARSVFAVDVDGDGDTDVLSASANDDKIAWYENLDGVGTFGAQRVISIAADLASAVIGADVDGDGDTDVLSASANDDKIAWYRNLRGVGNFGPQLVISTSADRAQSVFVEDLDGDGDVDVLSASANDDKIAWYENLDGAGNFGPQLVISAFADDAASVFAADLDGDGDVDVLSASRLDDKIAWYENLSGLGQFGPERTISTEADGAASVFAADVDGDGGIDVLSASPYDNKVAWYKNLDGLGTFGPQSLISTTVNQPQSALATDVDGDGDADVVFVSWGDREIVWCANEDGLGSFGYPRIVSSSPTPLSVSCLDADGDGDTDVFSASWLDDKIAWYENTVDGVGNVCDNCPGDHNPDQSDADDDGLGDACDSCPNDSGNDIDADGVCGSIDNCPDDANPEQSDEESDGVGDVCDNCVNVQNPDQSDSDGDTVGDLCDNCPNESNTGQSDADVDGVGDVCDPCPDDPTNDVDGDGVCGNVDNCPAVPNPDQANADLDNLGDACDPCPTDPDNDIDGDGVCGDIDNCPAVSNTDQADVDLDGFGDACDTCPLDFNPDQSDVDSDDHGDLCDNCPFDPNADQSDMDGDGLGNVCDPSYRLIVSDGSWRSTDSVSDPGNCPADATGPAWTTVGFDDSGWRDAYAPYFVYSPGVYCQNLEPLPGSDWIWDWAGPGAPNGSNGPVEAFFRRTLTLTSPAMSATVHFRVDDNLQLYVNGELAYEDASDGAHDPPVHAADITPYLTTGENVLAIRAWDGRYCDVYGRVCENLSVVVEMEVGTGALEVDALSLRFDNTEDLRDALVLGGTFALGEHTDGVDILNEDLTVSCGIARVTIPAGSFTANGFTYSWEGFVDQAAVSASVEDLSTGKFDLTFSARNIDLTGTSNPVTCSLVIGNDEGAARSRLHGKLYLRDGTEGNIVPPVEEPAPPQPLPASEWPQTGFDPQHTSFNPYERQLGTSNIDDVEVAWTNSVPCTINANVSVADEVVYYGHYCGQFRAVEAATGATLWTRSINTTHSGQAVVDGVAYVSARCTYSHCGTLYAFDAENGATLWTWSHTSRHVGTPTVVDGVVFVNTNNPSGQSLHAIDAATGVELWNRPGPRIGKAAVAGEIAYSAQEYGLLALDRATGDLLWTGLLESSIHNSMPVVADGFVYVNSDDAHVHVFDAGGCGQAVCPPIWSGEHGYDPGPQPPAVGEGKVFVGGGSTFHAFDANGCGASSCSPLWTSPTACSFFTPNPSVANGVVYTTCGNNYIYAFNVDTGDVLWSYHTSGGYPMRASPVVAAGRLFHAATFNFRLYAFETPAVSFGIDAMDSDDVLLDFRSGAAPLDRYHFEGTLALTEASDGLDPLYEDLTFGIGSHEFTVPAGSFAAQGSTYSWNGTVDQAVIEVVLEDLGTGKFALRVDASNAALSRTPNPMACRLAIGNDSGAADVRLRGTLQLRDESSGPGVPVIEDRTVRREGSDNHLSGN